MRRYSKYQSYTEKEMIEIVTRLRCLSQDQLYALLPCREGRTPENIEYAVDHCIQRKQFLWENGFFLATPMDKVDYASVDSIWIMITQLGVDSIEKSGVFPSLSPKADAPQKLCYVHDGNVYYVIFLLGTDDAAALSVIDDRIRAKGRKDSDNVRILIGLWDADLADHIPQMSFPAMAVHVQHPDGDFSKMPRFSFLQL